eukprot:scaffold5911_cov127-Isochrysis_galbana.AAC.6
MWGMLPLTQHWTLDEELGKYGQRPSTFCGGRSLDSASCRSGGLLRDHSATICLCRSRFCRLAGAFFVHTQQGIRSAAGRLAQLPTGPTGMMSSRSNASWTTASSRVARRASSGCSPRPASCTTTT